MLIHVPVSWGELLDKITILEIKAERITDPAKTANVARELAALRATRDEAGVDLTPLASVIGALRDVNEALWQIEDDIRDCERQGDFGARFVALARDVYRTNDKRAALKRQANEALGSELVEEKSYAAYD
ncbi:MAG: DUF6165 family protein [Pseudomonadota bacterium]